MKIVKGFFKVIAGFCIAIVVLAIASGNSTDSNTTNNDDSTTVIQTQIDSMEVDDNAAVESDVDEMEESVAEQVSKFCNVPLAHCEVMAQYIPDFDTLTVIVKDGQCSYYVVTSDGNGYYVSMKGNACDETAQIMAIDTDEESYDERKRLYDAIHPEKVDDAPQEIKLTDQEKANKLASTYMELGYNYAKAERKLEKEGFATVTIQEAMIYAGYIE